MSYGFRAPPPHLLLTLLLIFGGCSSRAAKSTDGGVVDQSPQRRDLPLEIDAARPDLAHDTRVDMFHADDLTHGHAFRWAHACVIAASCAGGKAFSATDCVTWFSEAAFGWPSDAMPTLPDPAQLEHLLRCTRGGPSCTVFEKCFGGNWPGPTVCRGEAVCQGTRIVHADKQGLSFDCAAIGATCTQTRNARRIACCAEDCIEQKGACDGSTETGRDCQVGIVRHLDCGHLKLRCEELAPAIVQCTGEGDSCDTFRHKPRCLSSHEVEHCVNGKLHRRDCWDHPTRKVCDLENRLLPCGGEANLCAGNARCIGDRVEVCIDGNPVQVDCKAVGFDTCRNDLAICTPYL